jgi:2-(1,2-epoxy-1,2-dihydrophenyl)acetyl-CoA isomerase
METDTVQLELVEDDAIAIVYLNRPEALNALNMQVATDFCSVVDQVAQTSSVRAVIVSGRGKAFCAGGDLAAFKDAEDPKQFLYDLASKFHEAIVKIRTMNAPWIAAINGPCFGVGLSLACCCDFRVAFAGAKFSVAFTGVGLSPDSSLLYYLPKLVGFSKATEMTLLNTSLTADEALVANLVNRVVEADVVATALEIAAILAKMPTIALGLDKRMLDSSYSTTLDQHLAVELKSVSESAGTTVFQEGCAAFFERRKPNFMGS